MNNFFGQHKWVLTIVVAFAMNVSNTVGAAEPAIDIDIARQQARPALLQLARESGTQIILALDIGRDITLPALKGKYTLTSALDQLLLDSGLVYEVASDGMVMVKQSPRSSGEKRKSSNTVEVVEELVVTAQKRAQKLSDVPMSIAALTGDDLKKRGIENFADLALTVPSLSVQDSGTLQRRITLRGVGNVFGSSSLVGVYVDEIPVTGAPSSHLDIRTYDLERVEVLRGPQGTLYGEGSSGGTIRFITQSPELSAFNGNAGFATSTTRGGDPNHEFNGVVNIPLIEDELAVRISGLIARTGGWINQPARGLENINDQDVANIRTKLLWRPTHSLEIGATAIIHRNDVGSPPVGEDENGNFEMVFSLPATKSAEDDYDLYNLTVNYDLNTVQLLSTSSYIRSNKITYNNGNSVPIAAPPTPEFGQFGDWTVNGTIFSQELRLSAGDHGPLFWTFGAFYRDSDEGSAIPEYFFGSVDQPPLGPVFFSTDRNSKSWSVFGQVSYTFMERLEIGAGLRYFEDKIRFVQKFFGENTEQEKFDSTNPRVFARYDVNDDISIYANIAKGFRSGGFNVGNPPFEPEDVWSYELGSKMSLLGGQLDTEIAIFYSDYEQIQVIGIVPVGDALVNLTSNLGEAKIKGVEGLITWHLTDQLSLGLSGNAVDTQLTKIDSLSASHAEGDQLDLVPDYSAGVWLDYAFDWNSNTPGFARLDYNRQGHMNYRNRSIRPDYLSQSDSIDVLNARVGFLRDSWSVEFFGHNLLNERGFTGPLQIEHSDARARPRTVGIRVGTAF